MGGPYPPMLEPSSRLYLAPQRGGVPVGTKIMGTIPNGGWPKGPWHPLLGEIHSREARWGGKHPPYYSLVYPPRWPPHLGARLCRLLVDTIPILQIFTSHTVDQFLPIAWCRLQSSILSKIRPPEESPHRTRRALRGESDSSALEVVWRLVSGSF